MRDILLEQIKEFCPYCHKYVAFSWVEFSESGGDICKYLTKENWYSNINGVWAIGECPSCQKCVLIHLYEDGYGKLHPIEIFPHPLPSPTDERIPEKIRKDIDEAKICLSVNAFRACAGMCRRALQQACILKGARKRDLVDQIDELAEEGVITRDIRELAHSVRWVGNNALHPENPEVTEDDAKEILNLTEQFMEVIFVAPQKVKEIKEKHGKVKNDRNT